MVKNGLKFGDVVALAGRNSTQLHSSALGVLFSGGVFASVEPDMRICKYIAYHCNYFIIFTVLDTEVNVFDKKVIFLLFKMIFGLFIKK